MGVVVHDPLDGSRLDMVRGIEVRFANRELDDVQVLARILGKIQNS